jgi:hypothetical protein
MVLIFRWSLTNAIYGSTTVQVRCTTGSTHYSAGTPCFSFLYSMRAPSGFLDFFVNIVTEGVTIQ